MKKTLILAVCLVISGAYLHAQEQAAIKPKELVTASNDLLTPVVKTIKISREIELEYAEQGNDTGVPVILLHGFTDSWHSFEMVLQHLPASLRVFALSQRGHGNSSKPVTTYNPDDFANDIAAFIRQMRLGKVFLVGHSMGSTMVQNFAVKYPELIRGIVLVASFAVYSNKPMITEFKTVIDQLKDPIDSTFAADFQNSTIVKPIPEYMLQQFIQETQKVPAHVWKGVAAGWDKSEVADKLRHYNKPALIVWGDKDAYCPEADQQLLKNAMEHSNLLVYRGTGHAVHWEEPVRFATDLVQFINSNISK